MPEDEEKYFPSTGHSFKLRRPAGKKIRPEIQLNLVHEWSSFINVFSRNYSPLFLSLRFVVGYSASNSGFTRKAKEKSALWLPWICNECLLTAIFFSFRGERERENFIDERLPKCWISMESRDASTIGSGNREGGERKWIWKSWKSFRASTMKEDEGRILKRF